NFFGGGWLFACFGRNAGSRRGRNCRLAAIFRQRFTRKNDLFLGDIRHGRRCAARRIRTPVIVATRLSAAILKSAGLATLWRCIFRGRQIAPAWATLWASAARASATASPTATPAAITAPVSAAVSPSVTAAAKILDGAVVSAAGRIALRGIVMRREVLGRGSIGIRLAFFCRFGVLVFHG